MNEKKSKNKKDVNTLESFSEIIRKHGEETRQRDDLEIEKLETLLPDMIGTVELLDDVDLLDRYDNCLHGCYSFPRKMQLMSQYKEAIRLEIARRMVKPTFEDVRRKIDHGMLPLPTDAEDYNCAADGIARSIILVMDQQKHFVLQMNDMLSDVRQLVDSADAMGYAVNSSMCDDIIEKVRKKIAEIDGTPVLVK